MTAVPHNSTADTTITLWERKTNLIDILKLKVNILLEPSNILNFVKTLQTIWSWSFENTLNWKSTVLLNQSGLWKTRTFLSFINYCSQKTKVILVTFLILRCYCWNLLSCAIIWVLLNNADNVFMLLASIRTYVKQVWKYLEVR